MNPKRTFIFILATAAAIFSSDAFPGEELPPNTVVLNQKNLIGPWFLFLNQDKSERITSLVALRPEAAGEVVRVRIVSLQIEYGTSTGLAEKLQQDGWTIGLGFDASEVTSSRDDCRLIQLGYQGDRVNRIFAGNVPTSAEAMSLRWGTDGSFLAVDLLHLEDHNFMPTGISYAAANKSENAKSYLKYNLWGQAPDPRDPSFFESLFCVSPQFSCANGSQTAIASTGGRISFQKVYRLTEEKRGSSPLYFVIPGKNNLPTSIVRFRGMWQENHLGAEIMSLTHSETDKGKEMVSSVRLVRRVATEMGRGVSWEELPMELKFRQLDLTYSDRTHDLSRYFLYHSPDPNHATEFKWDSDGNPLGVFLWEKRANGSLYPTGDGYSPTSDDSKSKDSIGLLQQEAAPKVDMDLFLSLFNLVEQK